MFPVVYLHTCPSNCVDKRGEINLRFETADTNFIKNELTFDCLTGQFSSLHLHTCPSGQQWIERRTKYSILVPCCTELSPASDLTEVITK
jgi:hypothetical protein